MSKRVVIVVDQFVRETEGSWHCQFDDLDKPTYIPKSMHGRTFERLDQCIFECPTWLARKTAEALGLDLEDLTVEV